MTQMKKNNSNHLNKNTSTAEVKVDKIEQLENKVDKLVSAINETIVNVNEIFNNETFLPNIELSNYNSTNLSLTNKSNLCGKSIKKYGNKFLISDYKMNTVYYYSKNEDKYELIETYKGENDYGIYLGIENDLIVISNSNQIYIYNNKILEKTIDEKAQQINVYNNNIYILIDGKIHIYIKHDNLFIKKEELSQNIISFDLYDSYLIVYNKKNIILYEYKLKWIEVSKLNCTNLKNFKLYKNKLYINDSVNVKIHEINESKINEESNILCFTEAYRPLNISVNKDFLIVNFYLKNSNMYHNILFLYDLVNNKLIKKIGLEPESNEFQNCIIADSFDNNIIISQYFEKTNDVGNIFVIEQKNVKLEWKGELIKLSNKIELMISGLLLSDYEEPFFELNLSNINLPKMKEQIYYNNIPIVRLDVFDMIENMYINNLNIKIIKFENNILQFILYNNKKLIYNYAVYLNISYIY